MHLLAFVSRVLSDIITPALDRRFEVQRVSLLCRPGDLGLAYDIAGVCRNVHVTVNVVVLPPDGQPLALRQRLKELVQGAVCFNLSGASPVQAALAYELARAHHLPVMAIDHETDRLIWLSGGEHSRLHSGSEIHEGLSLEAYFGLYGSKVIGSHYRLERRNPHHEQLAYALAQRAAHRPKAVSLLNRLCNELDEEQFSRHPLPAAEHELQQWLADSGMVTFKPDGYFRCVDARARFFLAGGWLEVWLLASVAALQGVLPLCDAAVGVKVSHDGVENEYDVAIICNNRLFLIECKTIAATGQQQRGVGVENLFKLDSAASLGGLDARAMLASLYPPTDSEISRAQVQGIALLYGEQLLQSTERLREWLSS